MRKLTILTLPILLILMIATACQTGAGGTGQLATDQPKQAVANGEDLQSTHTPTSQVTVLPAATTTPLPSPTATLTPAPSTTPQPTATPTETPIPSSPAESIRMIPVVERMLVRPLYLTHANDDRLFVIEQAGTIRIIRDGVLIDTPFLDVRDRIRSVELEQGLLGLAFHPDYGQNGIFILNYTNLSGDTHISSFKVSPNNPDVADPGSERVLLTIEQPAPNHNGGQVAFGPDGYLYVGVGDGGGANDQFLNGQNLGTLLGTILRLDLAQDGEVYNIPASNPFVGTEGGRAEIWAWGLRNPWRFSFDQVTGDLFIADVGQNLWEEVHFQQAGSPGGENYGWNILEGSHCFVEANCDTTGLELPIFEYNHLEGCSITGGYMYRGSAYLELYGNYFVGDYCQGSIWRLFQESPGVWSSSKIYDGELIISSFGEDAKGELYAIDHGNGSVYQIGS